MSDAEGSGDGVEDDELDGKSSGCGEGLRSNGIDGMRKLVVEEMDESFDILAFDEVDVVEIGSVSEAIGDAEQTRRSDDPLRRNDQSSAGQSTLRVRQLKRYRELQRQLRLARCSAVLVSGRSSEMEAVGSRLTNYFRD